MLLYLSNIKSFLNRLFVISRCRQILRENNCLQTLLQHLKSHSLTIVSNACGTLWNLSARNAKDQEALWDMGAVSMLKNLIHSKHKMIAMGSAAALRNLMANRPAKYKDANIMSPGSSVPSLHVRKQKALEAELDAQHLSETFDNIDNLSPKTSHRNKQRHKQNLYSDYVLDSSRHDDSICRPDSFNPGNVTVLTPYINATVLPAPSSRQTGDSSRPERDRDRPGTNNYHTTSDGSSSKRIGLQLSTTAQITKVMDEVSNIHQSHQDRNLGSSSDIHNASDERATRKTSNHSHTIPYNFSKGDHSSRGCPVSYMKSLEYKMSSNDSLNSVSSTDGYGKRGQVKPSVESYSEDDESKFCNYGQYPAGLAHKIQSANHMDDNDTELDTPINYSLKYSDEQLNSGRQSPTQNDRWARPKHIVDNEMKQNEQRQTRNSKTTYTAFTENQDEKHKKCSSHLAQSENSSQYPSRVTNAQGEQIRASSTMGMAQKSNKSRCQVDDYDDDKTTNFSERYSEEEQPEDEDERQVNFGIATYNQEEHHVEQPIDYSRKYPPDVPSTTQKPSFSFSKISSKQRAKKDHVPSNSNTPTPSPNSNRQNQLHPNSAHSRSGQNRQKQTASKPPSITQETIQTYCVEDTPICFSRCSSLSSLSSAEDEIEGRERVAQGVERNDALQITEHKDSRDSTSKEGATNENRSSSHHLRTKSSKLHSTNLSPSDQSRHKSVEFSSGAKSPSKSGAQTPKSPPEHYVQETPLMFSRCTSVSSLDSFESHSIASSVQSEPCSGMVSGIISPSDLPDSPGQTMPPSRSKTPPPSQAVQNKRDGNKAKVATNVEERDVPVKQTVHAAFQRVQVLQEADTLLHFATESTPDGFSCASSLSALSLDEPYIPKDVELTIMPPVFENDQSNEAESDKSKESTEKQENKEKKQAEPEKDILDDTDDDIDILEECIISAMPTKSSRKNKKASQPAASKQAPPTTRKPSQLPVYKLLPPQNRLQPQKHVSFPHSEDMPRVYCVEGTPINFSTATSLSDLTIESPPNELVNNDQANALQVSTNYEKRDTIPTEGRSTEDGDACKNRSASAPRLDDDKTEEGDILAECIHSAMPKGKSHKPYRVKKIMDQINHTSVSAAPNRSSQEIEKKPTSPVKPMPQLAGRVKKSTEPKMSQGPEKPYCEARKTNSRSQSSNDKPSSNEERLKGSFAFDSPHHYTPIEGTPYCFSRNDSLSSLDFDEDDVDLSKEKQELRKEKVAKDVNSQTSIKKLPSSSLSGQEQSSQKNTASRGHTKSFLQKQSSFPPAAKSVQDRGAASDEKTLNFAIENTPVCFSRNSSLSSLSDIDQENNNKEIEATKENGPVDSEMALRRPQTSGYAPKSFHVEDTPVCFSRNSSLSSLSIDSEDDLLQECISSAMPKKKKPAKAKSEGEKVRSNSVGGILAEEPDLTLDLRDLQSPDSENAFSPDSETFDWKAIQEGANSIVSRLHQAAAAVSLSRQGSSDSDSILSLKSGISLGSPFRLTPDKEEKPIATNKGPRILKPGEKSALENKKSEDEAKGIKGGKKVYKSMITGKSRSSSDFSSQCKQPAQSNMPSISRGRTMIHMPGVRTSSPSTSPVSKKVPVLKNTSKNSSDHSTNSPRGQKPLKSEPVYNKPNPSPGGPNKGSRSGSRDSTPSRPSPQPLSRPLQSPGRSSISPGRNGISPPNKFSQLPRTSSPSTASTKSSGSGRMSYTSPGRQLSQPNLSKPSTSNLPKTPSGIPRSESVSRSLNQNANNTGSNKKVELSRMSSTKSSGSESDRSERPALVRQSTFIKEAPSPTLRRKLEESASFESLSSSSRADSPTRPQAQTPVLSPSLPDMSLSTHSVQAGGWRKMPPNLNIPSEHGDIRKRHDISRSHSESPSRLPITRSGTWKREHSKHSSSLPRVSTWRRTGSSSSILSASSESSEKARSEDERQPPCSFQGPKSNADGPPSSKGTWRKVKESEILEAASSGSLNTLGEPSTLEHKNLYQMAPAVSKTEDVWVRIEDCPINNPRSGRSPTGNSPPVIDNGSEQGEKEESVRGCQGRHNSGNGNGLILENRQKSFIKLDGMDAKGTDPKPTINSQPSGQETNENAVPERTPFSSSSSSKHSSPSGTVAARVTPFNYNPSPRKSNADSSTSRPSQIPTPVTTNSKKRDSKNDATDSSGSQSPKRHSGSYLVTSV